MSKQPKLLVAVPIALLKELDPQGFARLVKSDIPRAAYFTTGPVELYKDHLDRIRMREPLPDR